MSETNRHTEPSPCQTKAVVVCRGFTCPSRRPQLQSVGSCMLILNLFGLQVHNMWCGGTSVVMPPSAQGCSERPKWCWGPLPVTVVCKRVAFVWQPVGHQPSRFNVFSFVFPPLFSLPALVVECVSLRVSVFSAVSVSLRSPCCPLAVCSWVLISRFSSSRAF